MDEQIFIEHLRASSGHGIAGKSKVMFLKELAVSWGGEIIYPWNQRTVQSCPKYWVLKQTDPLRVKWSDWALMGTFYRQEVHCSRLTHLEAFNSLSSKRLQIQISELLLILFLL